MSVLSCKLATVLEKRFCHYKNQSCNEISAQIRVSNLFRSKTKIVGFNLHLLSAHLEMQIHLDKLSFDLNISSFLFAKWQNLFS